MSNRAIEILDEPIVTTRTPLRILLRRLYVPVATVVLVLLLGAWLVRAVEPLIGTRPEQRLETGVNPALTQEEATLARAVVDPGFASRGGREQLLFIGNSQTMALPYAQPWDISTPQWFQLLLSRRAPSAVDVHRGSLGGMAMTEAMIRVVEFGESVSSPAVLVLDVRPEMLSGLAVRNEVREEAQQPAVASELRTLAAENTDLPLAAQVIASVLKSDAASASPTPSQVPWPQRLENSLQGKLEALGWFPRQEPVVELLNHTFRKYLNRMLHVTSASPRTLKESVYAPSLASLELLLRYTQQKHIRTILYIGPLRQVYPNPERPENLARFHRDLVELAQRYNAAFLDYSNLIPEPYWTNYESNRLNQLTGDAGQPDFAHLRAPAHKVIAERLLQDVGPSILPLPESGTHTH